jgi:hypothetical protein
LTYQSDPFSYAAFFECYYYNSGTGVPANGNKMWNWWVPLTWQATSPWHAGNGSFLAQNGNANTGNARLDWGAVNGVVIY